MEKKIFKMADSAMRLVFEEEYYINEDGEKCYNGQTIGMYYGCEAPHWAEGIEVDRYANNR